MAHPVTKTVSAAWETPYAEDVWGRLDEVQTDSYDERHGESTAEVLAFGPVLGDPEDPRIARLVVHRHAERARLFWELTVQTAPEGEPPSTIREIDAKIGGRRGLARLLVAGFPAEAVAVGVFRIHLLVARAEYACRMLPRPLSNGDALGPPLPLSDGALLEQIGYRFPTAVGGVEEVALVYLHRSDSFSVRILANGLLKLDAPRWLPYADEAEEIAMKAFFKRAGEG